jgi:hypothetical protein
MQTSKVRKQTLTIAAAMAIPALVSQRAEPHPLCVELIQTHKESLSAPELLLRLDLRNAASCGVLRGSVAHARGDGLVDMSNVFEVAGLRLDLLTSARAPNPGAVLDRPVQLRGKSAPSHGVRDVCASKHCRKGRRGARKSEWGAGRTGAACVPVPVPSKAPSTSSYSRQSPHPCSALAIA